MTIQDYIQTLTNSTGRDWYKIACWGARSGPSFKDHFIFNSIYNGQSNVLLYQSHSDRATLKKDISISLAWGLNDEWDEDERQRIVENWTTNYPDKSGATTAFIDFFYNDSLVFRKLYASVDGHRCRLPVPHRDENGNFVVSRDYSELIRLLNSIEGDTDYDYYLRQSGITIIDESLLED